MAFAGWGTFIAAIAGPVAKRVMVALGFGIVSVVGVTAAIQTGVGYAKSALGGMTGTVADIAAIAGLFSAASILAGGLVASGALMVAKRFQLL